MNKLEDIIVLLEDGNNIHSWIYAMEKKKKKKDQLRTFYSFK
jgi:hypothetical protein